MTGVPDKYALAAAQAVIKLGGHPNLVIDGLWGPRSAAALKASPLVVFEAAHKAAKAVSDKSIDEMTAVKKVDDSSGREYFDTTVTPILVAAAREAGLRPSAVVAQVAMESDWGRSGLSAKRYNNLGGLKYNSVSYYPGERVGRINMRTREVLRGQEFSVNADFAAFKDLEHFAKVYAWYLTESNSARNRYSNLKDARSDREYFEILQEGGYATDPKYADLLMDMSRSVNKRYGDLVA